MWKKISLGLCIIVATIVTVALFSYRPLPERDTVDWQSLPTPALPSPLATAITNMTNFHPDVSGIKLLFNGREAFAMRAVLAASASQTIDAQYYIWHDDIAGRLLFAALRSAADRGVRVRLLLDDNNTRGMDSVLASLDMHKNIEVRLFNPFMHRDIRAMGYLSDFFRLNRRMHNKSFTVDRVATIIGGRNVGDEYFEVGNGVMFADLDVIAVGKVVTDVENDFQKYWNAASVYPFAAIAPQAKPNPTQLDNASASQEAQDYLKTVAQTNVMRYITEDQSLPMVWTSVRLISDDPAKGIGQAEKGKTVSEKLHQQIGDVRSRLTLISPYFVPTEAGTEALTHLVDSGVTVKVLTNSLSATDVAAVHAGYVKYRKPLLRGGVKLFELKSGSTVNEAHDRGLTGHSGSSLHAKIFTVDDERIFIGSFNLDPRSAHLNTEMGFLIDSPELTHKMTASLTQNLAQHAYQVDFNSNNQLVWRNQNSEGQEEIFSDEPKSTISKRWQVRFFSWLPIEWLL